MQYSDILDNIYAFLPNGENKGLQFVKYDLHKTLLFAKETGCIFDKLKYIHIAGTNGKGSVSSGIASVLQEHQYKVGLFTSPHIFDYRERIKIDGIKCSKDYIVRFYTKHQSVIHSIKPSFFEFTFVLAISYFIDNSVDLSVIETGLGGRLDSTNVITPLLSVITSISMDHNKVLGNSLEKIATEKAGIIKANTPIILSKNKPNIRKLIQAKAKTMQSDYSYSKDFFLVKAIRPSSNKQTISIFDKKTKEKTTTDTDLLGNFQLENLETILCVASHLKNTYKLKNDAILRGISHVKTNTKFFGRWEQIHSSPKVIVSVSHNYDGIKKALLQIDDTKSKRKHVIFGLSKDKNYKNILKLFKRKNYHFYPTQSRNSRALDHNIIAQELKFFGAKCMPFKDPNSALQYCIKNTIHDETIIILGSIYVVGELKAWCWNIEDD